MSPRTALIPVLAIAAASALAARERDPARSVIEAALERLGGEAHLRSQRMWFIAARGEENLSAELQGITPDRPTIRPHEEWLGIDAELGGVAWERRTPRNDHSLRWRRFVYRPDSTGVIVWTDSIGRMNAGGSPEARRRGMMRRIPHLLLLEAAQAESLQLGATRTIFGRRHQEVRVRLERVWISLWLSADSSLLGRADYRTVLPGRGEVVVQWEWSQWDRNGGVGLRPQGHRIVIDGRTYQRVDYQRFEAGLASADSLLQVPNELRSRRMNMAMSHVTTARPRADSLPLRGEVAPGIHVEEVAGFNVFIVEFAKFVLLVEAPAAAPGFESIPAWGTPDRIGAELASRIQTIARGRPLGYTVVTHAHSDHVGNAGAVANLSRVFLVPSDATKLIEAAITAPGRKPQPNRVQPVVRTRTISDSTRTVVIYDVAENPHSQHNLFVWLPRERIGFQGDLFYYDAGAAAPPADRRAISEFFARWLKERDISPRAVYGVHTAGFAGPEILNTVLSGQ